MVQVDDRDARALAVLLGALLRERAVAGRAVPHSMRRLLGRLQLALSASGQPAEVDLATSSLIGTAAAAELLGWGERRTRRHAADLDVVRHGDRLLYPEQAVREYAKALQDRKARE